MTGADEPVETARAMLWTGWGLSGLVLLFLAMDGGMKLLGLPVVAETMAGLGWPAERTVMLGILTLIAAALYAVPRTAVLGAIVMTAYLGGAVAAHLRLGNPLFSHVLFGVYLGIAMWAGLYLRSPRLRRLLTAGL